MGSYACIDIAKFPKQGVWLGKRARVCFHYNTEQTIMGTIIRDDVEEPWRTIIALDDGRVVLASECQYSLDVPPAPKE